jgi:hypothetical protein
MAAQDDDERMSRLGAGDTNKPEHMEHFGKSNPSRKITEHQKAMK